MAGFDNEVVDVLGIRLRPSTPQAIGLMQASADEVGFVNYVGDPEGNVAANPGSLCQDPADGQIYYKKSGTGNTGWSRIDNLLNASSFIPKASEVSLTTAIPANITSLSLSAGKWSISALCQFGGTPTITGPEQISIRLNSNTHGTIGDNSSETVLPSNLFPVSDLPIVIPYWVVELESTTTVYLVASGAFNVGTLTAYGRLTAIQIENPI